MKLRDACSLEDCKEIKPVNLKGLQPWTFIGRTDAKAEALILWPPDAKSYLTGKDPDAGKDWGQKGKTEDKIVGWHHWLNGHESEQAPGDGEGHGGLACCSRCSHKERDRTEQLKNNNQAREALLAETRAMQPRNKSAVLGQGPPQVIHKTVFLSSLKMEMEMKAVNILHSRDHHLRPD